MKDLSDLDPVALAKELDEIAKNPCNPYCNVPSLIEYVWELLGEDTRERFDAEDLLKDVFHWILTDVRHVSHHPDDTKAPDRFDALLNRAQALGIPLPGYKGHT